MDADTLCDWYLARVEKSDPANADNADLVAQALEAVVEVFGYVWVARDWPFRRKYGTVTIASGACSVALPADWQSFGAKGWVKRTSDGARLQDYQHDPQYIVSLQMLSSQTGVADAFSVFGTHTSSPFQSLIQTRYLAANTILGLWYNIKPPTLDTTTNKDKLKYIPEEWHEVVLKPGLRALGGYIQGDARKRDFTMDPAFLSGLNAMAGELFKPTQRSQWPSFFSR